MMNLPVNPPGFYKFSYQIRVDQLGNGDFPTVKEAADYAAILPLTDSAQCVIMVNAGVFNESPFTVPSWCVLTGVGHAGEDSAPCTLIQRLSPAASETAFISCEASAVITQVSIQMLGNPANFNAPYAIVDHIGVSGPVKLDKCRVVFNGLYDGANELNVVRTVLGGFVAAYRCTIEGSVGSGVTTLRSTGNSLFALYWCQFLGVNYRHIYYQDNDASGDRGAQIVHCRMIQAPPPFTDGFIEPSPDIIIETGDATTRVILHGTRVPLNLRAGPGTIVEAHPTPQQLETSLRATIATTAINATLDGYLDGTILAAGQASPITIDLPPGVELVDGQSFLVSNEGVHAVTVDGNGNLIDGAATFLLPATRDRAIFQYTGSAWIVFPVVGTASRQENVRTTAVNTNLIISDGTILVDTSGGDRTVTMPIIGIIPTGVWYTIKKVTPDLNLVILDGNGALIDDSVLDYNITTSMESISVMSDGTKLWLR